MLRGAAITPPVKRTKLNENGFSVGDDKRPCSRSNRRRRVCRHYVRLRFHELKRTNISLMIANCVEFRIASKQAGHSKVSTTMDIHSDAFSENDRTFADVVGKFLN